jgi:hypothetical protein
VKVIRIVTVSPGRTRSEVSDCAEGPFMESPLTKTASYVCVQAQVPTFLSVQVFTKLVAGGNLVPSGIVSSTNSARSQAWEGVEVFSGTGASAGWVGSSNGVARGGSVNTGAVGVAIGFGMAIWVCITWVVMATTVAAAAVLSVSIGSSGVGVETKLQALKSSITSKVSGISLVFNNSSSQGAILNSAKPFWGSINRVQERIHPITDGVDSDH